MVRRSIAAAALMLALRQPLLGGAVRDDDTGDASTSERAAHRGVSPGPHGEALMQNVEASGAAAGVEVAAKVTADGRIGGRGGAVGATDLGTSAARAGSGASASPIFMGIHKVMAERHNREMEQTKGQKKEAEPQRPARPFGKRAHGERDVRVSPRRSG